MPIDIFTEETEESSSETENVPVEHLEKRQHKAMCCRLFCYGED